MNTSETWDWEKPAILAALPLVELDREEERYLVWWRDHGYREEACRALFDAVARWVWAYAKRYSGKTLSWNDAGQIASLEVWRCLPDYDPARGRLTTWATLILRRGIPREHHKGALVRRPEWVVTAEKVLDRELREWLDEHEQSAKRAAQHTALGDAMEHLLTDRLGWTAGRARMVRQGVASDAPLRSLEHLRAEYEASRDDVEPAEEGPAADEQATGNAVTQEVLAACVTQLTSQERRVIFYYFEHEELTLADIGREIGITRERVRQLYNRAILKLRHYLEHGTPLPRAAYVRAERATQREVEIPVVRTTQGTKQAARIQAGSGTPAHAAAPATARTKKPAPIPVRATEHVA